MKMIQLNDEDFLRLQNLSVYFYTNHSNIINDNKLIGKLRLKRKPGDFEIFSAVIGYALSTFYGKKEDKILQIVKIKTLFKYYDDLKKSENLNENDKVKIDEALTLQQDLYREIKIEVSPTDQTVLSQFEKTQWHCFERHQEAIGRNLFTFKHVRVNSKEIDVDIDSTDPLLHKWTGKGYLDKSQNYLCIQTEYSKQSGHFPTNYLFRIDSDSKEIKLCIGHETFIHKRDMNVITKTVVMKKLFPPEKGSSKIFLLEDGSAKASIESNIYRFLRDRKQNRLASPRSIPITNEKDLDEWFRKNDTEKKKSLIYFTKGNYTLCYQKDEVLGTITQDKLWIRENSNSDIDVYYSHRIGDVHDQMYKGNITYSALTHAVFITLLGPLENNEAKNSSPVFLILNIPSSSRNFQVLTGIISGIRDEHDGPISLLTCVVKRNDNEVGSEQDKVYTENKIKNDPIIKDDPDEMPKIDEDLFTLTNDEIEVITKFFKIFQKNGLVLTPPEKVTNLAGLNKAVMNAQNKENFTDKSS